MLFSKLYTDYQKTTPKRLKIIDAYMFYILITGVLQFVYCLLVGTFPFNAFLAGFISCVASFVLAVGHRASYTLGFVTVLNLFCPVKPSYY
uniref:Dolichyl-diphosphooligosaccharide--protein glycosyltransferase subunit DAD1 n=1 Tax=Meloidogyne enterolobii TaxID=390850 RepID=A0A6V7U3T8_MELEN|nr:unnamed protein product [Meloidogyne enterolobii]